MKFSDVFARDSIVAELSASSKEDAIRQLVKKLVEAGELPKDQAASAEKAILRREELGSTGIGKGVAVPHAKVAGIKGTVGALGRSLDGVAFNALDGQPVHLVFLLISSPDEVQSHLNVLRRVTSLIKDDDFCRFFKRAKGRDELAELLREAEGRIAI